MGQKRKRLALSCVDCRRRKVKCDRTYPVCLRCQKGGNADNCNYVSHTGLEPSLPTPSENSPDQQHPPPQVAASGEPYVIAALREMSPHMEVQSRQPSNAGIQGANASTMHQFLGRAAQLESFTRSAGVKPAPTGLYSGPDDPEKSGYNHETNPASDFSKVMVRGQNFSTHYYGPSFAISMLLQFEELSKFVKGLLVDVPSLEGIKQKMVATRAITKGMKKSINYDSQTDLIAMIPDRVMTDKLIDEYFATFEVTYRILHVPIFRREYEAFWQNKTAAKSEFVVLLLLIISCMYTLVPGGPAGYVGRMSARREVALRWISVCESWLEQQSQKHITLSQFQAHALVLVSKMVNCVKIKREWTASGSLLRFAMAVGMHREPSMLSKRISVFDQEMRRRLWFTIVELDLLATISRGMPPTIDSFSWDCLSPRNIHDEEFDEQTEHLPQSKHRSIYTRTSFLNIAVETLPLRVEILSRINSVRLGLDLDGVMQYDSKLREVIDSIPTWKGDRSSSLSQRVVSLMLYDYILILQIPFVGQTQGKAKHFYSVASKRDISFKTLQIYASLPDQARMLFSGIRDECIRASLALSHDMATSSSSDVCHNNEQALYLLGSMVETLGQRFSALGQGFHCFWITLSAYSLLKSKLDSSKPVSFFSKEAGDRVSTLYHEIISHQVPMPLPNGDPASNEAYNILSVPSISESLESFDAAFPGFDQINLFDDPFSDMNFDLSSIWNLDGTSIPNY